MVILFVIAGTVMLSSAKVVRKDQRGLLFRLGKFVRVLRPGFHVIAPFLDKLQIMNLSTEIPNWSALSDKELDQKVKDKFFLKTNW